MIRKLWGVRLAAKPAVSKTVTGGSSPPRPANQKRINMKKFKRKHYSKADEPDCSNCMYRVWLIALGLGIFCNNKKNKGIDLGFGIQGYCDQPFLPHSKPYCCENYKVRPPYIK